MYLTRHFYVIGSIGLAVSLGSVRVTRAQTAGNTAPASAAVLRAPVRGQEVVRGAAAGGGDLIIEWIEKPVFTKAELAVLTAPRPEPTAAQRVVMANRLAAAKAAAPAEQLLFTPRITAFPGHISLVEWFTTDADRGYAEAAAWVQGPDLAGTIGVVGDLYVKLGDTGKTRRYLVMPSLAPERGGFASKRQLPSPEDFGEAVPGASVVLMDRGDASDGRTMEPLQALLSAYADPVRGAKITADAAAWKAAQATAALAAAWEAAHPQPPEPQIVRFYTSQEDEISTLDNAAKARREAAAVGPVFPDTSAPATPADAFAK